MEGLQGIFDSHAHYDDPAFDPDREEVLASLAGAGVSAVMNIGADLESSRMAAELRKQGHRRCDRTGAGYRVRLPEPHENGRSLLRRGDRHF